MAGEAKAAKLSPKSPNKGGKILNVQGFPYETTAEQLKDFFADCGVITCSPSSVEDSCVNHVLCSLYLLTSSFLNYSELDLPVWPDSGRSKGYAIVTWQTSEAASKALSKNGQELGGRWLAVEAYKPQKKKGKGGKYKAKSKGATSPDEGEAAATTPATTVADEVNNVE